MSKSSKEIKNEIKLRNQSINQDKKIQLFQCEKQCGKLDRLIDFVSSKFNTLKHRIKGVTVVFCL